jgi:hypothetical protein
MKKLILVAILLTFALNAKAAKKDEFVLAFSNNGVDFIFHNKPCKLDVKEAPNMREYTTTMLVQGVGCWRIDVLEQIRTYVLYPKVCPICTGELLGEVISPLLPKKATLHANGVLEYTDIAPVKPVVDYGGNDEEARTKESPSTYIPKGWKE